MAIVNLKEPEYLIAPFIEKHYINIGAPHRHENFYEIEYIIKGTGTSQINEVKRKISSGDFYFITPLDVHSYKTGETPSEVYNVHFSEASILPEYQNILFNTQLRYTHFDDTKIVQNLFELMLEEGKKKNRFTNSNLCYYLNLIIAHFIGNAKPENITADTHPIIQDIIRYVRIHITEALTLSELAKRFNFSAEHLSRLFRRELDTGFKQYITLLRLDLAKNLLSQTDMSIIEISYESGFSGIGTFLRSFKKNCGMTPSQYRERHST